jgi:putative transposase
VKKSLSKKAKKVIEEGIEDLMMLPPLAELTRIGARMMLQSAMEEEVTVYLQRDYYERNASARGSRSGSKPRTVKIGSGDIGIRMPQVKNAGGPFHSLILPPRVTQMDEIQEIIPLLYMNGLSTRKVKKAVGKLIGKKGLSHQNVMRISGRVVKEFNIWKRRDLSELNVVYLILDGVRLGVRAGTTEKETVLVAWGFLEDGSRELISVSLGNRESYSSWKGFLDDPDGPSIYSISPKKASKLTSLTGNVLASPSPNHLTSPSARTARSVILAPENIERLYLDYLSYPYIT